MIFLSAKPIGELKQDRSNWLFLFQLGYGLIATPLAMFNFASVTYYLVVVNFAILQMIFPSFQIYAVFGLVIIPFFCVLIGLIYAKSPYYKSNYEVGASVNPYSFIPLPKEISLYTVLLKICEEQGYENEAKELRKVLDTVKE